MKGVLLLSKLFSGKIKSLPLLIFFLLALQSNVYSQPTENLNAINKVWAKFYQAFETLDEKPMAEIHSKELLRISGGKRILDYETYIDNYKTRFTNAKRDSITYKISLRFFERINTDSRASERGVYQLIKIEKQIEETYYGQFHVIFKKENGAWKITMDYDSNEANSIDEKDYLEAQEINEFDHFIKD